VTLLLLTSSYGGVPFWGHLVGVQVYRISWWRWSRRGSAVSNCAV